MGSWLEAIKKVSIVLVKFDAIAESLERIAERQIEIGERVARLEERLGTINESARSAAQMGAHEIRTDLTERITRLEIELAALKRNPEGRALPPGKDEGD